MLLLPAKVEHTAGQLEVGTDAWGYRARVVQHSQSSQWICLSALQQSLLPAAGSAADRHSPISMHVIQLRTFKPTKHIAPVELDPSVPPFILSYEAASGFLRQWMH
jgi:hypothetical protein